MVISQYVDKFVPVLRLTVQYPVYEGESEYFFHDSSSKIIHDDELSRLISFYNVFVRYMFLVPVLVRRLTVINQRTSSFSHIRSTAKHRRNNHYRIDGSDLTF